MSAERKVIDGDESPDLVRLVDAARTAEGGGDHRSFSAS